MKPCPQYDSNWLLIGKREGADSRVYLYLLTLLTIYAPSPSPSKSQSAYSFHAIVTVTLITFYTEHIVYNII